MRPSAARLGLVLALLASACAPGGRTLATGSDTGGTGPARFIALGTEPFWAAEVDGTTLLYTTPEDQAGRRATVSRRAINGRTELTGNLAGDPLVLRIEPGLCSDGMSDTTYPLTAQLRIGALALKGCAKPR